jgi:hypothetical protein
MTEKNRGQNLLFFGAKREQTKFDLKLANKMCWAGAFC